MESGSVSPGDDPASSIPLAPVPDCPGPSEPRGVDERPDSPTPADKQRPTDRLAFPCTRVAVGVTSAGEEVFFADEGCFSRQVWTCLMGEDEGNDQGKTCDARREETWRGLQADKTGTEITWYTPSAAMT